MEEFRPKLVAEVFEQSFEVHKVSSQMVPSEKKIYKRKISRRKLICPRLKKDVDASMGMYGAFFA